MTFITAHSGVLLALLVALLDFAIALAPSLDSNGLFHAVYLWLKGAAKPPQA